MGLAIAAAVKGYKMVFTMPEKMSQEKQDALRGLGATVLRTPTEYPRDHLYGYLGVAFSLADKLNEKKERKIAHCSQISRPVSL